MTQPPLALRLSLLLVSVIASMSSHSVQYSALSWRGSSTDTVFFVEQVYACDPLRVGPLGAHTAEAPSSVITFGDGTATDVELALSWVRPNAGLCRGVATIPHSYADPTSHSAVLTSCCHSDNTFAVQTVNVVVDSSLSSSPSFALPPALTVQSGVSTTFAVTSTHAVQFVVGSRPLWLSVVNGSHLAFSSPPVGTYVTQLTSTDTNGTSSAIVFTVTVVDTLPSAPSVSFHPFSSTTHPNLPQEVTATTPSLLFTGNLPPSAVVWMSNSTTAVIRWNASPDVGTHHACLHDACFESHVVPRPSLPIDPVCRLSEYPLADDGVIPATSFVAQFSESFSDHVDGFSFVVQAGSTLHAGHSHAGLGSAGLPFTLSVEFDTSTTPGLQDPADDAVHVSVRVPAFGDRVSPSHRFDTPTTFYSNTTSPVNITIVYDDSMELLNVWIGSVDSDPVVSTSVDAFAVLGSGPWSVGVLSSDAALTVRHAVVAQVTSVSPEMEVVGQPTPAPTYDAIDGCDSPVSPSLTTAASTLIEPSTLVVPGRSTDPLPTFTSVIIDPSGLTATVSLSASPSSPMELIIEPPTAPVDVFFPTDSVMLFEVTVAGADVHSVALTDSASSVPLLSFNSSTPTWAVSAHDSVPTFTPLSSSSSSSCPSAVIDGSPVNTTLIGDDCVADVVSVEAGVRELSLDTSSPPSTWFVVSPDTDTSFSCSIPSPVQLCTAVTATVTFSPAAAITGAVVGVSNLTTTDLADDLLSVVLDVETAGSYSLELRHRDSVPLTPDSSCSFEAVPCSANPSNSVVNNSAVPVSISAGESFAFDVSLLDSVGRLAAGVPTVITEPASDVTVVNVLDGVTHYAIRPTTAATHTVSVFSPVGHLRSFDVPVAPAALSLSHTIVHIDASHVLSVTPRDEFENVLPPIHSFDVLVFDSASSVVFNASTESSTTMTVESAGWYTVEVRYGGVLVSDALSLVVSGLLDPIVASVAVTSTQPLSVDTAAVLRLSLSEPANRLLTTDVNVTVSADADTNTDVHIGAAADDTFAFDIAVGSSAPANLSVSVFVLGDVVGTVSLEFVVELGDSSTTTVATSPIFGTSWSSSWRVDPFQPLPPYGSATVIDETTADIDSTTTLVSGPVFSPSTPSQHLVFSSSTGIPSVSNTVDCAWDATDRVAVCGSGTDPVLPLPVHRVTVSPVNGSTHAVGDVWYVQVGLFDHNDVQLTTEQTVLGLANGGVNVSSPLCEPTAVCVTHDCPSLTLQCVGTTVGSAVIVANSPYGADDTSSVTLLPASVSFQHSTVVWDGELVADRDVRLTIQPLDAFNNPVNVSAVSLAVRLSVGSIWMDTVVVGTDEGLSVQLVVPPVVGSMTLEGSVDSDSPLQPCASGCDVTIVTAPVASTAFLTPPGPLTLTVGSSFDVTLNRLDTTGDVSSDALNASTLVVTSSISVTVDCTSSCTLSFSPSATGEFDVTVVLEGFELDSLEIDVLPSLTVGSSSTVTSTALTISPQGPNLFDVQLEDSSGQGLDAGTDLRTFSPTVVYGVMAQHPSGQSDIVYFREAIESAELTVRATFDQKATLSVVTAPTWGDALTTVATLSADVLVSRVAGPASKLSPFLVQSTGAEMCALTGCTSAQIGFLLRHVDFVQTEDLDVFSEHRYPDCADSFRVHAVSPFGRSVDMALEPFAVTLSGQYKVVPSFVESGEHEMYVVHKTQGMLSTYYVAAIDMSFPVTSQPQPVQNDGFSSATSFLFGPVLSGIDPTTAVVALYSRLMDTNRQLRFLDESSSVVCPYVDNISVSSDAHLPGPDKYLGARKAELAVNSSWTGSYRTIEAFFGAITCPDSSNSFDASDRVGDPVTVFVGTPTHSPSHTYASGAGTSAAVINTTASLTVHLVDDGGAPLFTPLSHAGTFHVEIGEYDSLTSFPARTPLEYTVIDNTDGTLTIEYVPIAGADAQSLHIYSMGQDISGSPYTVTITPLSLDPAQCSVLGKEYPPDATWDNFDFSTLSVTAGRAVEMTVVLRDLFGNEALYGNDFVEAEDLTTGSALTVSFDGSGRRSIEFSSTVGGIHSIRVFMAAGNVTVGDVIDLLVTPDEWSPAQSTISGPSTASMTVCTDYMLQLRDQHGNAFAHPLHVDTRTSVEPMIEVVMRDPVTLSVVSVGLPWFGGATVAWPPDSGDGQVRVRVCPFDAQLSPQTYTLETTIKYQSDNSEFSVNSLSVELLPGKPVATHTFVNQSTLSSEVTLGSEIAFGVELRDALGFECDSGDVDVSAVVGWVSNGVFSSNLTFVTSDGCSMTASTMPPVCGTFDVEISVLGVSTDTDASFNVTSTSARHVNVVDTDADAGTLTFEVVDDCGDALPDVSVTVSAPISTVVVGSDDGLWTVSPSGAVPSGVYDLTVLLDAVPTLEDAPLSIPQRPFNASTHTVVVSPPPPTSVVSESSVLHLTILDAFDVPMSSPLPPSVVFSVSANGTDIDTDCTSSSSSVVVCSFSVTTVGVSTVQLSVDDIAVESFSLTVLAQPPTAGRAVAASFVDTSAFINAPPQWRFTVDVTLFDVNGFVVDANDTDVLEVATTAPDAHVMSVSTPTATSRRIAFFFNSVGEHNVSLSVNGVTQPEVYFVNVVAHPCDASASSVYGSGLAHATAGVSASLSVDLVDAFPRTTDVLCVLSDNLTLTVDGSTPTAFDVSSTDRHFSLTYTSYTAGLHDLSVGVGNASMPIAGVSVHPLFVSAADVDLSTSLLAFPPVTEVGTAGSMVLQAFDAFGNVINDTAATFNASFDGVVVGSTPIGDGRHSFVLDSFSSCATPVSVSDGVSSVEVELFPQPEADVLGLTVGLSLSPNQSSVVTASESVVFDVSVTACLSSYGSQLYVNNAAVDGTSLAFKTSGTFDVFAAVNETYVSTTLTVVVLPGPPVLSHSLLVNSTDTQPSVVGSLAVIEWELRDEYHNTANVSSVFDQLSVDVDDGVEVVSFRVSGPSDGVVRLELNNTVAGETNVTLSFDDQVLTHPVAFLPGPIASSVVFPTPSSAVISTAVGTEIVVAVQHTDVFGNVVTGSNADISVSFSGTVPTSHVTSSDSVSFTPTSVSLFNATIAGSTLMYDVRPGPVSAVHTTLSLLSNSTVLPTENVSLSVTPLDVFGNVSPLTPTIAIIPQFAWASSVISVSQSLDPFDGSITAVWSSTVAGLYTVCVEVNDVCVGGLNTTVEVLPDGSTASWAVPTRHYHTGFGVPLSTQLLDAYDNVVVPDTAIIRVQPVRCVLTLCLPSDHQVVVVSDGVAVADLVHSEPYMLSLQWTLNGVATLTTNPLNVVSGPANGSMSEVSVSQSGGASLTVLLDVVDSFANPTSWIDGNVTCEVESESAVSAVALSPSPTIGLFTASAPFTSVGVHRVACTVAGVPLPIQFLNTTSTGVVDPVQSSVSPVLAFPSSGDVAVFQLTAVDINGLAVSGLSDVWVRLSDDGILSSRSLVSVAADNRFEVTLPYSQNTTVEVLIGDVWLNPVVVDVSDGTQYSSCPAGLVRCSGVCQSNSTCAIGVDDVSVPPSATPPGLSFCEAVSVGTTPLLSPFTRSDAHCASLGLSLVPQVVCPPDTPLLCPGFRQRCVADVGDCPSLPTCSVSTRTLCPDGSCVEEGSQCPPTTTPLCSGLAMVTCSDGSCRSSTTDCPTHITCPSGACTTTTMSSSSSTTPTCPSSAPVRCPDGSCRLSHHLCGEEHTAVLGVGTPTTCPRSHPVLCWDGQCATSVGVCTAPQYCPPHSPTRCPTSGHCVTSTDDCPSTITCPPTDPIKCWDASCVSVLTSCPSIPAGTSSTCGNPSAPFRCASGHCVPALSQCPTPVRCPVSMPYLHSDGSCSNTSSTTHADDGLSLVCLDDAAPVKCPDGSCHASIVDCPQSIQCPLERPVRCGGFGCVRRGDDCPASVPVCPSGSVTCPDGSCSYTDCASSPTCPLQTPLKCVTGQCVASVSDCPATEEHPCASAAPFRCESRECVAHPSDCSPSSNPLCPDVLCATTATCVSSVVSCPSNTSTSVCGDECDPVVVASDCPVEASVRCDDGSCVASLSHCLNVNGCPPSSPLRCANGTCAGDCTGTAISPIDCGGSGMVTCDNGECALTRGHCRLLNGCESHTPFRCSDGTCQTACTPNSLCPLSSPVRCADGSCVGTGEGCSHVQPCPVDASHRCDSGLCVTFSVECESACPPSRPVMCSDGHCVTTVFGCTLDAAVSRTTYALEVSETTCGAAEVRCVDGTCVSTAADCGGGTCDDVVCGDGSCVPTVDHCPVTPSCPLEYQRCIDGSCVPFDGVCPSTPTTPCLSGVWCDDGLCYDTDCPASDGCPPSAPFHCADGTCSDSEEGCDCVDGQCGSPLAAVAIPTVSLSLAGLSGATTGLVLGSKDSFFAQLSVGDTVGGGGGGSVNDVQLGSPPMQVGRHTASATLRSQSIQLRSLASSGSLSAQLVVTFAVGDTAERDCLAMYDTTETAWTCVPTSLPTRRRLLRDHRRLSGGVSVVSSNSTSPTVSASLVHHGIDEASMSVYTAVVSSLDTSTPLILAVADIAPSPSPSASPSPSSSSSPTPSPSSSSTLTSTSSSSPTASSSPSASPSTTPSASSTASSTPSRTSSHSGSSSPSVSPSATPTVSISLSHTPSTTSSSSVSPSNTRSLTPTPSVTASPTPSPTASPTTSPTSSPSSSLLATPSTTPALPSSAVSTDPRGHEEEEQPEPTTKVSAFHPDGPVLWVTVFGVVLVSSLAVFFVRRYQRAATTASVKSAGGKRTSESDSSTSDEEVSVGCGFGGFGGKKKAAKRVRSVDRMVQHYNPAFRQSVFSPARRPIRRPSLMRPPSIDLLSRATDGRPNVVFSPMAVRRRVSSAARPTPSPPVGVSAPSVSGDSKALSELPIGPVPPPIGVTKPPLRPSLSFYRAPTASQTAASRVPSRASSAGGVPSTNPMLTFVNRRRKRVTHASSHTLPQPSQSQSDNTDADTVSDTVSVGSSLTPSPLRVGLVSEASAVSVSGLSAPSSSSGMSVSVVSGNDVSVGSGLSCITSGTSSGSEDLWRCPSCVERARVAGVSVSEEQRRAHGSVRPRLTVCSPCSPTSTLTASSPKTFNEEDH